MMPSNSRTANFHRVNVEVFRVENHRMTRLIAEVPGRCPKDRVFMLFEIIQNSLFSVACRLNELLTLTQGKVFRHSPGAIDPDPNRQLLFERVPDSNSRRRSPLVGFPIVISPRLKLFRPVHGETHLRLRHRSCGRGPGCRQLPHSTCATRPLPTCVLAGQQRFGSASRCVVVRWRA